MKKIASYQFYLLGMLLMIIPDALTFYLIMPMPGSQDINGLEAGYYLDKILWFTRIAGAALCVPFLLKIFSKPGTLKKIAYFGFFIVGIVLVYLVGYQFRAERIFYEPSVKKFTTQAENKFPEDRMVLGVDINGEAKAYPLIVVGYHHKIQDTIGGKPVLITYCTMCRSGVVYDPFVNGKFQHWRLVGMGKWNAIIEDESTKSWWYQADGSAGAGPLKGTKLTVLPSEQVTLKSWLERYPNSLIMQPDPKYQSRYDKLKNYDVNDKTAANQIEDPHKLSDNSWVIAVMLNGSNKYFSWNQLQKARVLNDTIGAVPIVIALENDGQSFHAWNRVVNGQDLTFSLSEDGKLMDNETHSTWNGNGKCIDGALKDQQLTALRSEQVYWRTWQKFFDNKN